MAGAISIMIVILVLGIAVDMMFTRVDTTIRRRRGMVRSGGGVRPGRRRPYDRNMPGCAGIVLAGGRSSRMGTPKAALEWHGSTLLRRTVGIIGAGDRRAGRGGPRPRPGAAGAAAAHRGRRRPARGPGAGAGAGRRAGRAHRPGRGRVRQLHRHAVPPSRLRPAGAARGPGRGRCRAAAGAGLPAAAGRLLPGGAGAARREAGGGQRLRPAFLFEECAVSRLDEAALRADPVLAALDPGLDSVVNVNEPADYQAALARPAPEVTIQRFGALADGHRGPQPVLAATVGRGRGRRRAGTGRARGGGAERGPDHQGR